MKHLLEMKEEGQDFVVEQIYHTYPFRKYASRPEFEVVFIRFPDNKRSHSSLGRLRDDFFSSPVRLSAFLKKRFAKFDLAIPLKQTTNHQK